MFNKRLWKIFRIGLGIFLEAYIYWERFLEMVALFLTLHSVTDLVVQSP
jgi:hypothetical protein